MNYLSNIDIVQDLCLYFIYLSILSRYKGKHAESTHRIKSLHFHFNQWTRQTDSHHKANPMLLVQKSLMGY